MKTTLTALALFTILAIGATSVQASCGTRACGVAAPACSTCASQQVPVEYEQVCSTCNTGFFSTFGG